MNRTACDFPCGIPLVLRHDNADLRLTPTGYDIGLITEERHEKFMQKKNRVDEELIRLKTVKIRPEEAEKNAGGSSDVHH